MEKYFVYGIMFFLLASTCAAGDVKFKRSKVVVVENDGIKEREASMTLSDSDIVVAGRFNYHVITRIPYNEITGLVYEQSTHPRVAAAIFLTPLILFTKGTHHWFSIKYTPMGGKPETMLLRLDKSEQRVFRNLFEQKTGKKIEVVIGN